MADTARIIEVFPSIQGEGIYVGRRHLFIRFWNCNLACHYCDTEYRGAYREYTVDDLEGEVRRLLDSCGPFHAVSLTGGEPLLWGSFLQSWLPRLKGMGQRTYLETNGTMPDALRRILPWTDIVAMDVKPPSATADRPVWREHAEFLRIACAGGARRPELFVKVVVTRETLDEEIRQAAELVRSVGAQVPLVLQPVTPWGPVREGPLPEQLDRWQRTASGLLSDVRILPQVHRILGVA
jgi:organic radical activating enzyme